MQYAGINAAAETGRFDQVTLGWNSTVKTITLTNGGTYKILAAGNNAEGNYKNIVIGAGGDPPGSGGGISSAESG